MNAKEIQESINNLHYWDARVKELSCNYFADEVILVYEDSDGDVRYSFLGCYKENFEHWLTYEKIMPSKQLTLSQIPYFLQNVTVTEVKHEGIDFYFCKINMHPLYIEILCKDIIIER